MVKQSFVKCLAHNLLQAFGTQLLRLMFFNHLLSLFFFRSGKLWRNYVYYLQGYFKVKKTIGRNTIM